jgi:hypothetical protein
MIWHKLNPAWWLERWIHRGTEGWVPEGSDPVVLAALDWSDRDSGRDLIDRAEALRAYRLDRR